MTTNPPPEILARLSLKRVVLGVLIAAVLVVLVVRASSSREELLRTFSELNTASLAGPLALSLVAFVLSVVRWRLVLAAMGFAVPFGRCLRAVLAAWPVAAISPARVGDGVRALVLRENAPVLPVLGSVAMEKIFDLHSLALLAAAGLAIAGKWLAALAAATCVLAFWGCFVGSTALLRNRDPLRDGERGFLGRTLVSIGESLTRIRARPAMVAGIVLLSLLGWLLSTAVIRQLLAAAGQEATWGQLLAAWPVAVLASALPISISGVGARDGAFLLSLRWIARDVDNSSVVAATLLYPLVTSWSFALIGIPFLATLWRSRGRSGQASG